MKKIIRENQSPNRPVIPLFFAVDDSYSPCLAVALASIADHANPDYEYRISILTETLSFSNRKKLSALQTDCVRIDFVSVKKKMQENGQMFHLRDYYSKATYYRFFIPDLFPQYDKGLYLDCDMVFLADVSKLYSQPLGSNYVGAVVDDVMLKYPIFGKYTEEVLDIPATEYFSAGVLVMNLKKMREIYLEERFVQLLKERTFRLTQDQDYLNVLCRNRVKFLSPDWNRASFPDADPQNPGFGVHYKMNWKPWHYSKVSYDGYFWKYAEQTPFFNHLKKCLKNYSSAEKERDTVGYERLVDLAKEEIQMARRMKTARFEEDSLSDFGAFGTDIPMECEVK